MEDDSLRVSASALAGRLGLAMPMLGDSRLLRSPICGGEEPMDRGIAFVVYLAIGAYSVFMMFRSYWNAPSAILMPALWALIGLLSFAFAATVDLR